MTSLNCSGVLCIYGVMMPPLIRVYLGMLFLLTLDILIVIIKSSTRETNCSIEYLNEDNR
jgi:hypothetical protein